MSAPGLKQTVRFRPIADIEPTARVRLGGDFGDDRMSVFEHSFSLIGLVLGLALVEVLGALIRTMKQRHTIKIGWLTPMLAIFVVLDTTTF